jgi:hypothetical protein
MRGLNSGNAWYHSAQNLLSPHVLSKDAKNWSRQRYNFVFPCGCETCSPSLWEEHLLRVLENRRIFGPKRDEVTRVWRKLRNQAIRDLYSSLSIIKIIKLNLGCLYDRNM